MPSILLDPQLIDAARGAEVEFTCREL